MSCYLLGRIYGLKMANHEMAILYHERSVDAAEKLKDYELMAGNYLNSGILYYRLGLFIRSLDEFTTSLDLYKNTGNTLYELLVRVNMASIYAESGLELYAQALDEFRDVLGEAIEMKSDSLYVIAVSHYTTALIGHGEFAGIEPYLKKALSIVKDNDAYADFIYTLYINEGEVALHRNEITAAIGYFEMAKEMSTRYKIAYGKAQSLLELGKAYVALKDTRKAEDHYLDALHGFSEIKMKPKIAEVYGELSSLAGNQKLFEKAFQLRSLQLSFADSLYRNHNDLLLEMQSNASSVSLMAILKKDEHINTLYINLLAIVVLVSFFLVLLYLNHHRLRSARDKATLAREKLELEKELLNKSLQEEQLKQKLEFNAKALTANTLNLIQKNEILEKIKTTAEEIRNASPADLSLKIRNLVHTANFALNIDKDWEHFKVHFEQVHNNFFDHLKTKYPNLNSSDLKLCALLKLNLDTKEIATIMNISPQSVKVARSRLRKKLNLDISSNLSSVITQM
jgi:tetratricopeptide (TPR) repeat protein